MTRFGKKVRLAVMLLCFALLLCACGRFNRELTPMPSRDTKPLHPGIDDATVNGVDYTPVYVSVFENVAILARAPLDEYQGVERECPVREISQGGTISCFGDHEEETTITKVIIAETLVPRATSQWFSDMARLEKIEGLEKVKVHHVTDMSYMFRCCLRLASLDIDDWDVSKVEKTTGIFDDCIALDRLPIWYEPEA